MNVLITGGAGYIGSHTHHLLCQRGWNVVILDDLSSGFRWAVNHDAKFIEGDYGDTSLLNAVFSQIPFDAVIHLAGYTNIVESLQNPLKYYDNNTLKLSSLLRSCANFNINKFIYASTASTYGVCNEPQISEDSPQEPISPYGRSKLMGEWMVRDFARKHANMTYIVFRYFNVAGAHPNANLGQATGQHLVKVASQAALGLIPNVQLFGTDYPTADGTCIRDFLHVMDLAEIHLSALTYLMDGGKSDTFNCGYGQGHSVLEVLESMKTASSRSFDVCVARRRGGDPPSLIANTEKIRESLAFSPQFNDLELLCHSAFRWEESLSQRPS